MRGAGGGLSQADRSVCHKTVSRICFGLAQFNGPAGLQRLGDVMLGFVGYVLACVVLACVAVVAMERVIGWVVRWAAPILPNDIAGPDGWLIDTQRNCGVFDPVARG